MAGRTLAGRQDSARGRIGWQDSARGLGAMLVVFGHVERGLMTSGIGAATLWHPFDFAIYTFHMPLFMFLSGLNVQPSLRAGYGAFTRSKLLTVAWPYVVWCWVIGLFGAAFSRFTNHPFHWQSLFAIGWAPITLMWFLYALFVFMMMVMFIGARRAIWLAILLFPLAEFFDRDDIRHQLLHFFLFFVGGVLLGRMRGLERWRIAPLMVAGAALLYGVSVAAALAAGQDNYNSMLMLPGAVGGGLLVLWLAQRLEGWGWLAYLGRCAMAIYVMHVPITACLRILFQKVLHVPPLVLPYLLVGVLGGVLLPMLALVAMRRLGVAPWLGLSVGPRGREWIKR